MTIHHIGIVVKSLEKNISYTFQALVLSEEDRQRYRKVHEDLQDYADAMDAARYDSQTDEYGPVLPLSVYNFDGKVTAENLRALMLFRSFLSTWEGPSGITAGDVPASEVKSWLEEALVVTGFDVKDSPLYNAEDDTISWETYRGGWGARPHPMYRMNWTRDNDKNWIVEYTTYYTTGKTSSSEIVYASDGRIVSIAKPPKKLEINDKETGIRLEASEGVVPSDTVLKTEKVTDGENFKIIGKALEDTADKWVAYDIRLLSNNAEIQPNGKVKITMPIPENLNMDKAALFHVAENGKLTKIAYTLDKTTNTIAFEIDHFSLYAVAETNDANPPTGDAGRGILPFTILLMAGAAVLLLIKRQTAR